jgi:hypothetical protein
MDGSKKSVQRKGRWNEPIEQGQLVRVPWQLFTARLAARKEQVKSECIFQVIPTRINNQHTKLEK